VSAPEKTVQIILGTSHEVPPPNIVRLYSAAVSGTHTIGDPEPPIYPSVPRGLRRSGVARPDGDPTGITGAARYSVGHGPSGLNLTLRNLMAISGGRWRDHHGDVRNEMAIKSVKENDGRHRLKVAAGAWYSCGCAGRMWGDERQPRPSCSQRPDHVQQSSAGLSPNLRVQVIVVR
jgi:hypothetical protein